MLVIARVDRRRWVVADASGSVVYGRSGESLDAVGRRFREGGVDRRGGDVVRIDCAHPQLAATLNAAFSKPAPARNDGEKPHVSATQLDLYAKCPEAYRRRYVEGHRIPPPLAVHRGKALHRAIEANARQKIESRVDLPAADLVEVAVENLRGEVDREGVTLQDAGESVDATIDDVVALANAHATMQAPDYQPTLVEHKVRIVLPAASRDLLGVVDLMDDQGRVVDFKTAKRKPSQADADSSTQLTVYASAATIANHGEPPAEVRLDALIGSAGGKGIRREVVRSDRGRPDFAALANRLNTIVSAIDAGVFTPAAPGAWWCSPKWCGYWSSCPFVNQSRGGQAEE